MKRIVFLGLWLAGVLGGPVMAAEVRSPGAAPYLAIQVPDGALTETQPGQVVVTLEANTLPILTMATLPFDPTKIDLKSPDIYPVLGASLIKNLAQSAGGPVSGEIKPGSHVFIGGKPGYVYKATIQNQRGEEMSVELTLLTLDPGHIGMFALISVQGQAAVRGFEDIIRAATVVSP